jgi:diguanylate cyclase (GGDEF)-like protein
MATYTPEALNPLAEAQRAAALRELALLDTPPEKELDDLVRLASALCNTPISQVTLVDDHRQWFKASVGSELTQTHRDLSFCSHAIRQSGLFLVEDASLDPRFAANPLVTGAPGIRFYAGVPIGTTGGPSVGTLCVIDTQPRTLTASQRDALAILGDQLRARFDLRLEHRRLELAIHDNQALMNTLKTSNQLLLAFMNNGPFATYIKDEEGRIVFYNRYLATRFHISEQEWIGRSDYDIWPPALAAQFRRNDLDAFAANAPIEFEETTEGHSLRRICWRVLKFPFLDADGNRMLAGISVDITREIERESELESALRAQSALATQLAQANLRLELLATTDALTGLANRRAFDDRAFIEFAAARRKVRPLSIIVLDIDDFKQRNDVFGHATGDEALKVLANILTRSRRADDLAARIGGEEFALLLPETDAASALGIANRLQALLRLAPHGPAPLTVSIGIATIGPTTADWQSLMVEADEAMYHAKRTGKDRIVHHRHRALPTSALPFRLDKEIAS